MKRRSTTYGDVFYVHRAVKIGALLRRINAAALALASEPHSRLLSDYCRLYFW